MKKIFLGILTVLTLTLFVGCIKETEIKPDEEITNPIGTIKCINTLDELMSDDYQPKFEINNDEYIDGEFPYINMNFAEANEINNLMKAYALITKAVTLASDKTYEEDPDHGVEYYLEPSCDVIQNDKYIFIKITGRQNVYWDTVIIGIDIVNNKLLTKEEILAIKDYNLEENMETLLDNIFVTYYDDNAGIEKDNIEGRREEVKNYILTDIKNNDLYFFSSKYDSSIDLKEYGKVKLFKPEIDEVGYEHYDIVFDDYRGAYGELNVYPYINENNNLVISLSNQGDTYYNGENEIIK